MSSKATLNERCLAQLWKRVRTGHQRRIAELAGLSPETLTRWKTGTEPFNPTLSTVQALAAACDVEPEDLLGLSEEPSPATRSVSITYTPTGDAPSMVKELTAPYFVTPDAGEIVSVVVGEHRFLPVPHLQDPVGAGYKVFSDGSVEGLYLFREEWARKRCDGPLYRGRLLAIDVISTWLGTSMEPTILSGAEIIVDRGPDPGRMTGFVSGQVYLVRSKAGVTVRRVWLTGKALNCHADNREKEPLVIPLHQGESVGTYLVGKVIFVSNPVR